MLERAAWTPKLACAVLGTGLRRSTISLLFSLYRPQLNCVDEEEDEEPGGFWGKEEKEGKYIRILLIIQTNQKDIRDTRTRTRTSREQ